MKSYLLKNTKPVSLLCGMSIMANLAFGQILDAGFGNNGKLVDTAIYEYWLGINSSVIQQQNKILIAGYVDDDEGYYPRLFLRRYYPDGSKDGSFAWNGELSFLKKPATGGYMMIQPDGKIVAAGSEFDRFGLEDEQIMLFRFRANGSLDLHFGDDGKVSNNFGGFYAIAQALALKSDGKILVTGYIAADKKSGSDHLSFVQFLNNGKLDENFGKKGIIYPTTSYEQTGVAIKSLPDSKTLVAFAYSNSNTDTLRTCLIRYTKSGTIDRTFGEDGIVLNDNPFDTYSTSSIGLVIQPDGKILEYTNYRRERILFRYNANGTPDNSFGVGGKIQLPFRPSDHNLFITLQHDGKILVNAAPGFAIARYCTNGDPDVHFGEKGILRISFEGYSPGECQNILLQPDGKIVMIGHVEDYLSYLAVARFNNTNQNAVSAEQFIAVGQPHSVLLKWQTAPELNNSGFIIERSADNVNFKEIGTIKNNSHISVNLRYNFEDITPCMGINYYRLKKLTSDSSISYSKIATINFTNAPQIAIAPNPVKDILQIRGLNAFAKSNLYIIRSGGKTMKLRSVSQSALSWNIHDLPAGAYYLLIKTNNITTSMKFIKE